MAKGKARNDRVRAEREIAERTAKAARDGAHELARGGFGAAAEGLAAVGALARDTAKAHPGWSESLSSPFFKKGGR